MNAIAETLKDIQAQLQHERDARIAAQTENEALKAKLAASGVAERRAVREAVLKEREACARLCEQLQAPKSCSGSERSLWDVATLECAHDIRARGDK